MPDERAYRIELRFDTKTETFTARAPELGLHATGAERSEAIAQLEEAIEARLQDAAAGEAMPEPIDDTDVETTFTFELSQPIARELVHFASRYQIEPTELAKELLAHGIGALGDAPRRGRPQRSGATPGNDVDDDASAQGSQQQQQSQRRRGRRREGYRPELEDKANFMEYLRGLDRNRGGGGGGGRGRR